MAGHDEAGNVVPYWDIPTLAGAGALRSTANDMLKFLAANLDTAGGPLHRAMAGTQAARHQTDAPGLSIALGWHIQSIAGAQLVWHNGGTGGFRTFLGFDPARRIGVIVLGNSAWSADDIGFHLLNRNSPLMPTAKPRQEVALAPALLDRYVGVYELSSDFRITITRDGAALFGQATKQPRFQLYAESDTSFFLKLVDAEITFERDSAGKATRLVLHQGGQHLPGRRID